MKRISIFLGIALTVVLVAFLPKVYSQVSAETEKTFVGQLVKVDTTAQVISVKGADDKEMLFKYNSETLVIGPDKTVQGLTGKAGVQLRVNYYEDQAANWATRIELIEQQAPISLPHGNSYYTRLDLRSIHWWIA